jgi:hypothetical protein
MLNKSLNNDKVLIIKHYFSIFVCKNKTILE